MFRHESFPPPNPRAPMLRFDADALMWCYYNDGEFVVHYNSLKGAQKFLGARYMNPNPRRVDL